MCRSCSITARGLDGTGAPRPGDWFIEHAIGRRGVPVAYTVGLTGIQQPELIIREMGFSLGHRILHELIATVLAGSLRLEPGSTSLGEGQGLLLRRYAHSIELTEAILRYEGIINVLQVVPVPFRASSARSMRPASAAAGPEGEVVPLGSVARRHRLLRRQTGA
ncbi:MAG: hypothetical protein ACTHWW_07760 [Arthrobacter sp.]|uniref:hypothetical protein n=1 Tax=unclassified Arthrobacter TaxID=235627 RepID=UPI0026537E0D|nr:DUF4262 domain-containing protein [Micrococcaceae bacterium]MDN5879723.1 DUF4262 domain-containing protein [Micrococcaceae bacterium]MDN5886268.1 DUF4262 domain-containing protein [Micrococcaceae bacterium]MDN6170372.1 DUF4262 domain-containing protein [Micrococcaceae bacterium]MDN6300554.1 DUF4262 domain-containing protein [Micrococcaceae bacterium]